MRKIVITISAILAVCIVAITIGILLRQGQGVTPAASRAPIAVTLIAPQKPTQIPATIVPTQALPTATSVPLLTAKVGETVRAGGYVFSVVNVDVSEAEGPFGPPKEGMHFVSVEIIVESDADTGVSSNGLYASLRDSQGYTYSETLWGKEPSLKSQNDIRRGDKVRGWMTFEIPKTATGLRFLYDVTRLFSGSTYFDFSLGI